MTAEKAAGLAAALARLQTQLPSITKDSKARIDTKTGPGFSYSYADLADISDALLPVMGALGLAFTASPTLNGDGKFVLAYSLMHASGESRDGDYPLPSGGDPKQIGSAITYGRRYCLLAVTGAAPHGEDDDGKAAEGTKAGGRYGEPNPFDASQPVSPPKPAGNGHAQPPAEVLHDQPPPEAVTDPAWLDATYAAASVFATAGDGRKLWTEVAGKHRDGHCTLTDRRRFEALITARFEELKTAENVPAAAVTVIPPLGPEDPWTAKVDDIADPEEAAEVTAEFEQLCQAGDIPPAHAAQIRAAIQAKTATVSGSAA